MTAESVSAAAICAISQDQFLGRFRAIALSTASENARPLHQEWVRRSGLAPRPAGCPGGSPRRARGSWVSSQVSIRPRCPCPLETPAPRRRSWRWRSGRRRRRLRSAPRPPATVASGEVAEGAGGPWMPTSSRPDDRPRRRASPHRLHDTAAADPTVRSWRPRGLPQESAEVASCREQDVAPRPAFPPDEGICAMPAPVPAASENGR